MKYLYSIFLIFFITTSINAEDIVSVKNNCKSGLFPLEKSPFSIMLYCEGALGNYIGVVLSGHWSEYGSQYWKIGDRYWYQSNWGDDVTSYFYHIESDTLYVATSGFYGKAGVYKLTLKNKSFEKVYIEEEPKDSSEGIYVLESVSNSKLSVSYSDPIISFRKNVDLNCNKKQGLQ